MANPEGQQTPRRSRVKIVLTVGAVIAGGAGAGCGHQHVAHLGPQPLADL